MACNFHPSKAKPSYPTNSELQICIIKLIFTFPKKNISNSPQCHPTKLGLIKFNPHFTHIIYLFLFSFLVLLLVILLARNATRTSGKGAYIMSDEYEDDERANAPNAGNTQLSCKTNTAPIRTLTYP